MIQRISAERAKQPAIQPCNQFIVGLFWSVCTQWVYAGMSGVRVGLNYPAVAVRAEVYPGYSSLSVELKHKVWEGLQVMERAIMAESSQKQDK